MRLSRVLSSVTLAALLPLTPAAAAPPPSAPAAPVPAAAAPCLGRAEPGVEQARLERKMPRRILRRSHADERVREFTDALCAADSAREARRVVTRHGRSLWEWAVARAQGRIRVEGSLPGGDDRPLYWARVAMTRQLERWTGARGGATDRLVERLETTSRGQDTLRLDDVGGDGRVLVTGFDPFTLDRDARIGNPSGAAALFLDGRLLPVGDGYVRVETAVFPVRWDDFADGEVERALAPFVRRGPKALDALVTVSQGRPDRFDVEVWNGANRGGFADNENLERTGPVPVPPGFPTVTPQPQFTRTSLPADAMTAEPSGRYPVVANPEITERDPVTGVERTHLDGPTPGWLAVSGSPGDYLSNEIAYRATLLRDAVGATHPGGHLHTPVLGVPGGDAVTDRAFEARRTAMVRQVARLVAIAAD